jgi:hypothetical protein
MSITSTGERLAKADGQVIVSLPGEPCLRCFFLTDALLEWERQHRPPGYDQNPDAAGDPQVVSMNGYSRPRPATAYSTSSPATAEVSAARASGSTRDAAGSWSGRSCRHGDQAVPPVLRKATVTRRLRWRDEAGRPKGTIPTVRSPEGSATGPPTCVP